MTPVVELARSRGLDTTLLDAETFVAPAPADASLTPPITNPIEVLDGLRRRGLDPALLAPLQTYFRDRPLELGLVAWDYLAGCMFELGSPIVDELRKCARVIADLLPAPGKRALTDDDAKEAVRRIALPVYMQLREDEFAQQSHRFALGTIEVDQELHEEEGRPAHEDYLKATHHFARYLAYAHLKTAAVFYLQYLVHRRGYTPRMWDYVDAILDAGMRTAFGNASDPDLITYLAGRICVDGDAPDLLSEIRQEIDIHTSPRSALLAAHAAVLADEKLPFPIEELAAIWNAHSDWRHGQRASVAIVAHVVPRSTDLPLRLFDRFLLSFGNEALTWRDLDFCSKPGSAWLDGTYARSTREVIELPHDRAAWEALGVNLGYEEQKQWEEVVKSRIAEQCKLD